MAQSNPLVGKVITALQVAKDKGALRFVLTDGELIVGTDADCCSFTWIEHIELPALGFPATVLSVEDIPMPDVGQAPRYQEVVAYYGCKITTDRGEIVIDYRNESNGYYGGDLSWPGDHYYGGVHGMGSSMSTSERAGSAGEREAVVAKLRVSRDRDMRIARTLKAQGYGVVSPRALVITARQAHYDAMRILRGGRP